MARINATDIFIKVNDVVVTYATGGTLSLELDLPDASNKDSAGWAEHIQGQKSWSISVEGLLDYSASYGVDELANLIINRTSVSVEFGTGNTGDTKFSGTASLSSLEQDAPLEDVATYSGDLTGTGALTKATY